MKLQETMTTVKTLDNTTATFDASIGMFGMVEADYDGVFCVDNPINDDCNGIRFSINMGHRNGGVVNSNSDKKDGDLLELYRLVNKIENDNPAVYNGENSPLDCEYQINAEGYEIETEDGDLLDNPRYADKYDLEDTDYLDKLVQAAKEKGFYIAGVDVYEHSLFAFKLTKWDTRWYAENGIAWATPEDLKEAALDNEDAADKRARNILENYTHWVNGEVYTLCAAPAEYNEDTDTVIITGDWEYLGGILGFDWAERELPEWMAENRPAA